MCGEIEEGAIQQIVTCREHAEFAAIMADGHQGYSCPIGGVIASQELISPSAVGFDIACGNRASRLSISADDVRSRIKSIMDSIAENISFGLARSSGWKIEHRLFDDPRWNQLDDLQQTCRRGHKLADTARMQLGTVGSGNHYCDVMIDEQDRVWVGVHFGSRGFGHKIATWFFDALNAPQGIMAPPTSVHMESDLGEQYIACMELAGEYAYAGRDAVVEKMADIIGSEIVETVHNHHNFAWRENHNGRNYWVCRKGATPAFPGQKGFVGGSMGDCAVIVEGVDTELSKTLFRSTVHGAGRVISRTKATGRSKYGKTQGEPAIKFEEMMAWVKDFGVELRGADVDESPQAYKRLAEVLPEQGDTIRVQHTLKPIGVAMAGRDTLDPYKD